MNKSEAIDILKELEKHGNIGNFYVLYEGDNENYSISEFTDGLSYIPRLTEIARVQYTGES